MPAQRWKVSLHGGHSGEFCEHAEGTLREVLEAAATAGYSVFGVSEHAPRSEDRFLYASEREKGFDVERLTSDFEAYASQVHRLAREFEDRLTVLCGFEAEVVPAASYGQEMLGHRERFGFEFMVGSVHYVEEIQIDGLPWEFQQALDVCGGLEELAVRYYRAVGEMVRTLKPEVVGHLDLIRKNAGARAPLETPRIAQAAGGALEEVRLAGAVLDLNTAGYRKGLGGPYPAPWLVKLAGSMGVGFCFGDDSHGPAQVGAGIEQARGYLLGLGVGHVSVPAKCGGGIQFESIPL